MVLFVCSCCSVSSSASLFLFSVSICNTKWDPNDTQSYLSCYVWSPHNHERESGCAVQGVGQLPAERGIRQCCPDCRQKYPRTNTQLTQTVLKQNPDDKEAFHCKALCLIHQSKFEEALTFLESHPKFRSEFDFERAYCCYSTKKLQQALEIINNCPSPKPKKMLELEAQLVRNIWADVDPFKYYRLEDSRKCIQVYESLRKEHKVETPELLTNLLAAYISNGKTVEAMQLISEYKAFGLCVSTDLFIESLPDEFRFFLQRSLCVYWCRRLCTWRKVPQNCSK